MAKRESIKGLAPLTPAGNPVAILLPAQLAGIGLGKREGASKFVNLPAFENNPEAAFALYSTGSTLCRDQSFLNTYAYNALINPGNALLAYTALTAYRAKKYKGVPNAPEGFSSQLIQDIERRYPAIVEEYKQKHPALDVDLEAIEQEAVLAEQNGTASPVPSAPPKNDALADQDSGHDRALVISEIISETLTKMTSGTRANSAIPPRDLTERNQDIQAGDTTPGDFPSTAPAPLTAPEVAPSAPVASGSAVQAPNTGVSGVVAQGSVVDLIFKQGYDLAAADGPPKNPRRR